MTFIGRAAELRELEALVNDVRLGTHEDRGVVVLLRGGRRVGKSRLVAEFLARAGVPADCIDTHDDVTPADVVARAAALPDDRTTVLVVDDVTSLGGGDASSRDELRRVWDRKLAGRKLLLILVARDSDDLGSWFPSQRPWRGRTATVDLGPMSPAEIGQLTGLPAFDAFDARLITGGLPLAVAEWEPGMTRDEYLRHAFGRSTSALVVTGMRMLDGSLPGTTYASAILSAIGRHGERTFTGILNAISDGTMSRNSLTANLEHLSAAGLISSDDPLSARQASKDRRWRISDTALSFWLAFVQPALGDIDRAEPDSPMHRLAADYTAWRDRAIQPLVRGALGRLLPESRWSETRSVGSWWSRGSAPELALVGTGGPRQDRIMFAGTIAWRRLGELTVHDIDRLEESAERLPGLTSDTSLVAVCPSGTAPDPRIAQAWTADDLLAAWY